jgi:SAM-dependent methyltransferase
LRNPWLDIRLEDYEGHMSLPSIGQAQMLSDQLELLIERESPASVAIIGCAGGNGLERIAPGKVQRVVAVDINPRYVEETGKRHAGRLSGLELICADVQSEALCFDPVDLIYAALVFEYVDGASTLATLARNCKPGGTLAILLQLHDPGLAAVSPSPYRSLDVLEPMIRPVSPASLCSAAAAAGFSAADSCSILLDSGRRFRLQIFRRG